MSIWPSFFPPQCPPSDSQAASGRVYRLVSTVPPSEDDFRSYYEEDPVKWAGDCKACGVSVFRDINDLQRLTRRVRAMNPFVATKVLEHADGRLMHTAPVPSNSHHTWWTPAGRRRSTGFVIVETNS